jgi:hypothetical protein
MVDESRPRVRYGEAFWREAWRQSDLNQRKYCEAHATDTAAFIRCANRRILASF